MIKSILIALLLSLSTAYGQFVATDDFEVSGKHKTVENYNNHQHGDFINGPVTFSMKWEGTPSNLKVELKHDGDTFTVYPSGLGNSFSVSGINAFYGDKWGGDWQLKINSDDCFTVTEWSVVPEPSSIALVSGIALLGFAALRKKQ